MFVYSPNPAACAGPVPVAESIVPCDLIPGVSPMELQKYLTVVIVMVHHSDRAGTVCLCDEQGDMIGIFLFSQSKCPNLKWLLI